jgi:bifunctional UDP-N-acetylglucosamine pyrophosphorylase/glucosamine-1-phosphate N-acetyltransferase
MEKVGVIILAAGRGSRMNSKDTNKVALSVNDRPLILRSLDIIKSTGINEIVVVVGFAKESVTRLLPEDVKVAVQPELLGTGDAEKIGLSKISSEREYILSVYGDDSFLYTPEIFNEMVNIHKDTKAVMTLATVNLDNPTGYGRIIRDKNGKIVRIVEELNATDSERKIKEVNTGCYLFTKKFLEQNLRKIKKNKLKREYYLTDILEIFIQNKYPIASISIESGNWRGVNTPEELAIAEEEVKKNE